METRSISRELKHAAGNLNWWQLGLVTVVVSALGALSAFRPRKSQRKVYKNDFKQAPWAPPGKVFGPAWSFNNFFVLNALRKVLATKGDADSRKLLSLQAGIWFIYFTFGYVYFKKKSPVLAAIWTQADAALAIASLWLAAKKNKKLALNYLPLTAWTLYAGSVADYQALKNDDPLLETKAALS